MQVNGRSVREYGGTITTKGHIACKLPSWLQSLSGRVHETLAAGFFKHAPEHVLMNVYQPGAARQACSWRFRRVCSTWSNRASKVESGLCRISRTQLFGLLQASTACAVCSEL